MKIAKEAFIVILTIAAILPGAAVAEIITTHLDSDAELLALISDTLFAAEGRIGDLGGAATHELDLGPSTGNPAQTAQYEWQSGVVEDFLITYDHITGFVTFAMGDTTLEYTTPYCDFVDAFVRTRAVNDETSVEVYDLVLDGEYIDDNSSASGPDGLDILMIHGAILNDGFTLSGKAVLTWTGTPPTQSRLAFQIKIALPSGIGTEDSSWGAVKSLFR